MVTEDRVYAFGRTAIIELFENMFLEDFQQEFECSWVDETISWIPWDYIKEIQNTTLRHVSSNTLDGAFAAIEQLERFYRTKQVEASFAAGVDIGRKRTLTECMVVGKSSKGTLPLRLMISLEKTRFEDQKRVLAALMRRLPIDLMMVDENGIGSQLAEDLSTTFPERVVGAEFTSANKERWAVGARLKTEQALVPIPADRDLAYQIHSIKKKVTASKNNVFDTARNEKHHADKFWSWALAIAAGARGGASWIFVG
ncbi:MAG: hypothetical protein GWN86_31345 [Desulfobacterales bacterium]|nr:hypothetical protein [Desulfobacterales bacterium]